MNGSARFGAWLLRLTPHRQAVLLVAGDKAGADQRRFYRRLIGLADERYGEHLDTLNTQEFAHGKKPR